MSAPRSARPLPLQTPNANAQLVDDKGFLTSAWRYIFSLFVQRNVSVSPGFSQTISNPPTQAQVQALSNQVAAISKLVGLS